MPVADQSAAVTREDALAFADEAFRNRDIVFSHRDVVDMTGALSTFLSRRCLASVSSASAETGCYQAKFRALLIEAGRNAGAFISDSASDEFLELIPEEVRLKVELLTASPEPVPATNQAGEVDKLRSLIENLAEAEKQRRLLIEKHDVDFSPEANTAVGIARAAVEAATRELSGWSIANSPAILAALATQPATSQEGEEDCPGCTGSDPAWSGADCPTCDGARTLAATPTPPTLSEDLIRVAQRILDRGYVSSCIEEEREDHNALVAALAQVKAS